MTIFFGAILGWTECSRYSRPFCFDSFGLATPRLKKAKGDGGPVYSMLYRRDPLTPKRTILDSFCNSADYVETEAGWEGIGTWLLSTACVVASIRLARNRFSSGV